MKTFLKVILITCIATFIFILVSAIMPYSEGFKAVSTAGNPTDLLYVLLSNLWLCATIVFLVKNSVWSGRKLLLGIVFTLFMIYCFMTQIETWFFGSAFPLLTRPDIISIALANATPIFVATPLALRFFASQRKEITTKGVSIRWNKSFIARLLLLGVGYMVLYFIFGYFVAWQSEALRLFYTGSAEKLGFIAKLVDNYHEQPVIYPFQFIRGILFVLFIIPLVLMQGHNKKNLLISMLLVYMSTGIVLIIPNILFPDAVRWAHFIEMISSMFFLGILNWFVLVKSVQVE